MHARAQAGSARGGKLTRGTARARAAGSAAPAGAKAAAGAAAAAQMAARSADECIVALGLEEAEARFCNLPARRIGELSGFLMRTCSWVRFKRCFGEFPEHVFIVQFVRVGGAENASIGTSPLVDPLDGDACCSRAQTPPDGGASGTRSGTRPSSGALWFLPNTPPLSALPPPPPRWGGVLRSPRT